MTAAPAPEVARRPSSVAALFFFLTWSALRNRVLVQARRARSPRYLLPLLFGGLYVWFMFFRRSAPVASTFGSVLGSTSAETAAALGLLALAVNWWVFGGDRGALAFSPAEVDVLFPAPLTRRQLIHFKLLRSQALIVVNVLVWLLITRRGSPDVPIVLRAASFWALISTMHLHRLAASLVRTSAVEHGGAGARRNWVALAVLVALFAALGTGLARHWALVGAVESPTALIRALSVAFGEGPARWALLVPRTVLAPTFAGSAAAWRAAILPSLGVVALHYAWVLRTDAAFEEAAIEATARRAERVAAARARASGRLVVAPRASDAPVAAPRGGLLARLGLRRADVAGSVNPPWFALRPSGPPAGAITWKNVVAMTRTTRPATVVIPLLIATGVFLFGSTRGAHAANLMHVAAVMLATVAAMLVVAGPHYVRNDLRLDMPRLDLLRAYPLRGRDVVAAEIAAPLAVLTGIQLTALALALVAAFASHLLDLRDLASPAAWAAVVAGLVTLPALNAAGIAVQNAAALLFPSWMRLGTTRTPGIESLGQNLLAMVVTYLMLFLLLILPLLAAGLAFLWLAPGSAQALMPGGPGAAAFRPSPLAVGGGAVAAVAALWGEVALGVLWLGRVFERTEPAGEQGESR